ncbi:MAG: restriction endonuclease subunit S [Oribacterium sp.]|nr:restriction endonuclease subunit S [Oribacterium sp.]
MKSEWITQRLSEIVDFNPRESLPKGGLAKKIPMDALQPYCRDIPTYEVTEFNGGTKFRNGDTIMARITPCLENGKTAQVNILGNDEIGFGSTEFIVFRAKKGISDPDYIYYLVSSPLVRDPSIKSMVGSSGRQRVQTDVVQGLQVPVPPLEEQRKIAGILRTLDDKIKLNTEINKNLEEQAVVLFRSWFSAFSLSPNSPRVNSEFGEIPEDFAVVKVGSLPMLVTDYVANGSFASLKANVNLYQEPNYAYFIRNTDLKSGSFGVFVDQHSYEFLSKSTLYGGEIIISNVGDVGSVFLCPKLDGRMTLGNNIIMLRPEDDHLRYYLYVWFKYFQGQALIQGIKGGSAQPKFNKTDFKNTSVLIPPKDILTRFHETVAPMFETISQRQAETSRLADLRDTLLPQLMSGEIDVSDLDL